MSKAATPAQLQRGGKPIGHSAVVLDGRNLTSAQVVAVAREGTGVTVAAAARKRAARAHQTMADAVRHQAVYGQTTGVGANKETKIAASVAAEQGVRLLRSHAAGAGPGLSRELARAMLVVRLNQLAAGGSGVNPALLDTLENVINSGLVPPVDRYGAIGTGDLPALATTALYIMGERPWQGGSMPAYRLDTVDALAFISSNAATIGEAALASRDINQLLQANLAIASLSYLAMGGSPEPFSTAVQAARPHVGQTSVAADFRKLLGDDLWRPGRQVQDPYGLRALPQVHGPAIEAVGRLEQILAVELNAASENPLTSPAAGHVYHNGNFHAAYLGQALDALRVAVYGTAALSAARLAALMEPAATTLRPFLAAGAQGSSGALILEYVTHSALAELRHLANPDSLGSAVLSRGMEEHASFATQAAWHTTASVPAYETVLACELVAAVRALRQQQIVPRSSVLRTSFTRAAKLLSPDMSDRSLEPDIEAARKCLWEL